MATKEQHKLRDRRLPGHGWYDNEIYDVFGDELGQNGISVYLTLTRLCYGVSVPAMSLRELAAHARMSKDTVARTLKKILALGLVIERKGATPNSASTYDLVDVKALVARYREPNRQSVSGRDTAQEATLGQSLKRSKVTDLVEGIAEESVGCLTVRQLGGIVESEPEKNLGGSACDASVANGSDFETQVSQAVRHPLTQDTRHKTQHKNSPQPPEGGAGCDGQCAQLPGEPGGELREAVAKVMRECGLSKRKLGVVIAAAMRCEADRTGEPAHWNAVAERMIRNHRDYAGLGARGLLKFTVGAARFFGEMWRDDGLWGIDVAKLRREQEARLGT